MKSSGIPLAVARNYIPRLVTLNQLLIFDRCTDPFWV